MKQFIYLTLLGLLTISCESNEQENLSDDYVLIEFASKLEEDYDKLEKSPKKNNR